MNVRETALISADLPFSAGIATGHEIAALGSLLDRPKLILSGWVGLVRLLEDGRRQIVDLQIAGELTAFDIRPGATAKAAYVALTPLRLVEVGDVVDAATGQPDRFPNLAAVLRMADDDAYSRLLDQVVRVGRMLAHERIAHLALDLHRRHDRVVPSLSNAFPMPLTQEVLGDVLGLSTVHVNRTLQQMRRDGLLKTAGGSWQIPDLALLNEVASGSRPA
ncbi:MAG TPA: Crp/Fnr family transcriptional regulator [Rhizomicrobium sp.]|nr:Crp/Fnr family transcriptional regulator [Rhizomicrobium sp.]